eukprot:1858578-Rhodomonas_salina.3
MPQYLGRQNAKTVPHSAPLKQNTLQRRWRDRRSSISRRAMLCGFGYEQVGATEVWEDNAACIQIAKNPVNRKS